MKLTKEDVQKYTTEEERVKLLEGHMQQAEFASGLGLNREVGLDYHLTGNFYPPIPKWVKDRIKDAFRKYWDGKLDTSGLINNLTKGTKSKKFKKAEQGPIMRDATAVYRYFGEFLDQDEFMESTEQKGEVLKESKVYGASGLVRHSDVSYISQKLDFDIIGAFDFCLQLLEDVNAHTEMDEVEQVFERAMKRFGR